MPSVSSLFYFFLFNLDAIYLLIDLCSITLSRTSNNTLNGSSKSRHPYLVLDHRGKLSVFLIWYDFTVGFLFMAFIVLKWFPSSSSLLSVFVINRYCILSIAFSASIKFVFSLHSVNII